MKLIIAHRGLTDGPDPFTENHPDIISENLHYNIPCEVDVWYTDKGWYLGHDAPQYAVSTDFIKQDNLWLHAKNVEALEKLGMLGKRLNYFWHNTDDYTMTSCGYIWAYPGKPLTNRCIAVLPEISDYYWSVAVNSNCMGICTDYVSKLTSQIY